MTKEKEEVFSIFQHFHKIACTQFWAVVKILRSDNGGEYIDSGLGAYFSSRGLFTKTLALTLLNRMEWQNTRIAIFWILLDPCFLMPLGPTALNQS